MARHIGLPPELSQLPAGAGVRTKFLLERALATRLKALANETNRSVSSIVRDAVAEYLEMRK